MTDAQRAAIRDGYLAGETLEIIAALAGVPRDDAEVYLRWWCDRGCPGAVISP